MPLSMLCCCVCLCVVRERNAVPHTSHQGTLGVWVHKHTFSWLLAVSGALLVVAGYGGEVAAIGTPAVAAGRNGCVPPRSANTHRHVVYCWLHLLCTGCTIWSHVCDCVLHKGHVGGLCSAVVGSAVCFPVCALQHAASTADSSAHPVVFQG